MLKRWAYLFVALGFNRSKYYFAWKNAEGACNIWYAGFLGFDDKNKAIEVRLAKGGGGGGGMTAFLRINFLRVLATLFAGMGGLPQCRHMDVRDCLEHPDGY